MRHFENEILAERYDEKRPKQHRVIIQTFVNEISQETKFAHVLDVACGTGHSSHPLLEISDKVTGVDISEEMVNIAKRNIPEIDFRVSPAERLFCENNSIDAAFVGMAFHWFDKDAFLSELSRILKPGGWLVIYGLGSPKDMSLTPTYRKWYTENYWQEFPNPPRSGGSFSEMIELHKEQFSYEGELNIRFDYHMNQDELRELLTTQSNIQQAVENGQSLESIDSYLNKELNQFFETERKTINFKGNGQYAKRV